MCCYKMSPKSESVELEVGMIVIKVCLFLFLFQLEGEKSGNKQSHACQRTADCIGNVLVSNRNKILPTGKHCKILTMARYSLAVWNFPLL